MKGPSWINLAIGLAMIIVAASAAIRIGSGDVRTE
jgi:hypothetical protein